MPLTVKPVEPLQTPDHVLQVPPQIPTHPIAWPSVSGAGAVDDELVQHILDEVEQAGAEGLDKAELYDMDGIEAEDVDNALSAIGAQRPLAVFWAGYDTARMVSTKFAQAWMQPVIMPDERTNPPAQRPYCTPRRWVDMYGTLLTDDLEMCVRGAVSQVVTRPGIREVSHARSTHTVTIQLTDRVSYASVWLESWTGRRQRTSCLCCSSEARRRGSGWKTRGECCRRSKRRAWMKQTRWSGERASLGVPE